MKRILAMKHHIKVKHQNGTSKFTNYTRNKDEKVEDKMK